MPLELVWRASGSGESDTGAWSSLGAREEFRALGSLSRLGPGAWVLGTRPRALDPGPGSLGSGLVRCWLWGGLSRVFL